MPAIPDTIIGHEAQCAQLLADIAKQNVSHAYLLAGPKHLGKFTVARWFASRLLSDHLPPERYSETKAAVERLIHPDCLVLDKLWIEDVCDDWNVIGQYSNVPQQHRSKGTPAKTDAISIDDVRSLTERLHSTGDSPVLCCLIRSVERMKAEASNALLKMLEEPPRRVIFVLTTENQSALLPTVVSRTRVLHFSPLTNAQIRPMLTEESDDASFALHLAQGAPGILTSLLRDPEALREAKQLHGQAKQFWQARTSLDRMTWLLKASEERSQLETALLHIGLALREYPDSEARTRWTGPYLRLLASLKTNAHRGLLLQRFTLELG